MGAVAFLLAIYYLANYEGLTERIGYSKMSDVLAGSIWLVLVLLATFRAYGMVIPLLVAGALVYALFGNHFVGVLFHSGIDYSRLIGYSGTYFMGSLGTLTGLSASLILHFLLFGALFQAVGGKELIEKMGFLIGTRFRSGAAQAAIASSSMLGMVSGSIPANVAMTGVFTIPMMIKRGYSREFSGAVESAASAGGQITPPIMSVVVFLIAGMTGIAYPEILIAATLPAISYYVFLVFTVSLHTRKLGLAPVDGNRDNSGVSIMQVIKDHGYLMIPFFILIWRILIGESPARSVLYANGVLLGLGFFHSIIKGKTGCFDSIKIFSKRIFSGLVKTSMEGAKLGVVLGSVGIIMEVFTVTGFGQRMSYFIVSIAGDHATIGLVFMVASLVLFFGMGMPSAGAYIIAALLIAPALVRLGFPVLSVHMFIFYFSMLSALTYPVCLGVLVAINISKGNLFLTSIYSMRLALPAFIMPFVFLYIPGTLGFSDNPFRATIINIITTIGLMVISVAVEGYCKTKLSWVWRAIVGIIGSIVILAGAYI